MSTLPPPRACEYMSWVMTMWRISRAIKFSFFFVFQIIVFFVSTNVSLVSNPLGTS